MRYEKNMIPAIKQFLYRMGYDLVEREVPAGSGIADLVGIKVNKKEFDFRMQNALLSPKNVLHYKLLYKCNGDWLSLNEISHIVKENPKNIKKGLKDLNPYFEIKKNGKIELYRKKRNFNPIIRKSIAIEAKLKDWKHAIIQAKRYISVSNLVYIAMPESSESFIEKKRLIEEGLGLIYVTENNEVYEVLKGKQIGPYNQKNLEYLGECVWNIYCKNLKKLDKFLTVR